MRDMTAELEARQNELYLAMGVVEEMPASEAQTSCITKLGARMRLLVELRGKSEVGRHLAVEKNSTPLADLATAVLEDRSAPPVLALAAFRFKWGDERPLRALIAEAIALDAAALPEGTNA